MSYDLHLAILLICALIGLVVVGVMLYSILQHRRADAAAPERFHDKTRVELAWTILPLVILVLMAVPSTRTLLRNQSTFDAPLDVQVVARPDGWQYEYTATGVSLLSRPVPGDGAAGVDQALLLPQGRQVRLHVSGGAWSVPDLVPGMTAKPGAPAELAFRTDRPGQYTGDCAAPCGRPGGGNPVVVRVVPAGQFAEWLNASKAKSGNK